VVATCVELVPAAAVGAVGVPVKLGEALSALEATAVAMLLNSVSNSAPLISFKGLPVARESFDVKLVLFT
jgi:hypothetical protein